MSRSLQAVIGLEVHAQIVSQTKLFSPAPSQVFGQEANACVSFIDAAMPGMLPVVNETCVHQAIRTGLAVGGQVCLSSVFERKHYFYPDNPAGYQISQFRSPLIQGGGLTIQGPQGPKFIRLQRIHIEQDAGQSLHDQDPRFSLVNFNRAGIGLMEIVSEPDLSSPEEVVDYVKRLRCLLRYLGACQGDMEKGNLRVDANVSVHEPGTPLGVRVELKNMNSLKFLHQALVYEIQRQTKACEDGQPLVQETRLFDPAKGTTHPMRTKEEASDYWYFPDPDLPPLALTQGVVDHIASTLPELPWTRARRFTETLGLSDYDAALLTEDKEVADYFENILSHLPASPDLYKLAANWVIGEVFAALNRASLSFSACPLPPQHLAELVLCVSRKELSHPLAKEVFAYMWESGHSPQSIMDSKGLKQVTNEDQLKQWARQVLEREAVQVDHYLAGKEKIFPYLVGQVMKESKGKANPQLVHQVLQEALEALRPSS